MLAESVWTYRVFYLRMSERVIQAAPESEGRVSECLRYLKSTLRHHVQSRHRAACLAPKQAPGSSRTLSKSRSLKIRTSHPISPPPSTLAQRIALGASTQTHLSTHIPRCRPPTQLLGKSPDTCSSRAAAETRRHRSNDSGSPPSDLHPLSPPSSPFVLPFRNSTARTSWACGPVVRKRGCLERGDEDMSLRLLPA